MKTSFDRTKYNFDPDPFSTHMLLLNEVPENSKVLELGSASGYLGKYLAIEKKCEVWGVEPVKTSFEQAKSEGCYLEIFNLTAEEFLKTEKGQLFDIIFLSDILEHLADPKAVLVALKDYLKPNGKFVISIPNVAKYDVRWDLLKGHWDMADSGILDRTHLRFFTHKTMKELFAESGLKIVRERPAGGYIERFGKRKLFKIGKKILFSFPELFSLHFIFVVEAK